MQAMANRAIFLVRISTVFFERTRPASNMAKPAAIHMTSAPHIKKVKRVECIRQLSYIFHGTPPSKFTSFYLSYIAITAERCHQWLLMSGTFYSAQGCLDGIDASFSGTDPNGLLQRSHENFSVTDFSSVGSVGYGLNHLIQQIV